MANDRKTLKGRVDVFLRDARTGKVVMEHHTENLVVNSGESWVAERMRDTNTTASMNYIELGLGTAAPTSANTGLNTHFAASRKSYLDAPAGSQLVSGPTWTLVVNWGTSEANTANIVEAGIFNTSTDDTPILLAHTVFPSVTKTNNDTLQIQWSITNSDDGV